MAKPHTRLLVEKLDGLRTELVDLAFVLEGRGQLDAADVAITTSARVGELCDELAAAAGPGGNREDWEDWEDIEDSEDSDGGVSVLRSLTSSLSRVLHRHFFTAIA